MRSLLAHNSVADYKHEDIHTRGIRDAVCVKIVKIMIVWERILSSGFWFAAASSVRCEKVNLYMSRSVRIRTGIRSNSKQIAGRCRGQITAIHKQCFAASFSTRNKTWANRPLVSLKYCWKLPPSPCSSLTRCWYAPRSSRLFNMLWTHRRCFLFFMFLLHFKLYAIAISIKSFCSISRGSRCNTDYCIGMLSLQGLRQKEGKSLGIPIYGFFDAVYGMRQTLSGDRMPRTAYHVYGFLA